MTTNNTTQKENYALNALKNTELYKYLDKCSIEPSFRYFVEFDIPEKMFIGVSKLEEKGLNIIYLNRNRICLGYRH